MTPFNMCDLAYLFNLPPNIHEFVVFEFYSMYYFWFKIAIWIEFGYLPRILPCVLLTCCGPPTTDTRWLNSWFFSSQIQIPIPNIHLGFGYNGLIVCRNIDWLMENIDKELTVPKWVLLNGSKIPKMPQNVSTSIVCPIPKVWYFNEKRLHLASIVRAVDLLICAE